MQKRTRDLLLGILLMGSTSLEGNPLSTGCMRMGWVKVSAVETAYSSSEDGRLWVNPNNARIYYRARSDQPFVDALLFDPEDAMVYTRDGNRREVVPSDIRDAVAQALQADPQFAPWMRIQAISAEEPLVWQDWERPIAISADARIVITESNRIFWFPEFNGVAAAPIYKTRLGWETVRLCTWGMYAEHSVLPLVPFSPAHRVVIEGKPDHEGLCLPLERERALELEGTLIHSQKPGSASSVKLLGISATNVLNSCASFKSPN